MKWQLLVTRETDLLERYLRVSGYSKMFGNKSKFKVNQILVVNNNGLTRQYVDEDEVKRNTKIVISEYMKGSIDRFIPAWKKTFKDLDSSIIKFKRRQNG